MNTTMTQLSERIDELLRILERDIEHIEQSVEQLDELRTLVIKRNDSGLNELLGQIHVQSQQCAQNQQMREQVRDQIAVALDWPLEHVRLGKLQEVLPEHQAARVAQMRQRVIEAVGRLRREHSGTSMLLADLARFNGMILNWILEAEQGRGVTYDARGGRSRSGNVAFVNLQF
jgi:hypothetical protein